ncbi:MAG: hypothetical protein GY699_20340, partial [Desulfobacteraceae bacterium]|nr:hypothetical protein [Desulfobacteraceae bacterium]
MNQKIRQKLNKRILFFMAVCSMLFFNLHPGFSLETKEKQDPVANQTEKKIEQSVQIRQQSQKDRSKWE